ncbi:hypothetical protein HPULCUR_008086 [Helicostylum pulchrum]|uniref:Mitotic-spindle organizing protein 1 n=1 Tax=Helicostylum pulchrum TaxID=562976 RepID=A0ABP9Y6L6_9FUNG
MITIKRLNDSVLVQPEEKAKVINAIKDYASHVLKDSDTLLDLLSNSWETDAKTKEEDIFISSFVDTVITNPTFKQIPLDLKMHGNGHSLKESRHRKIRQAKKNGGSLKGWKGRILDRSLELQLNKKSPYHVFLCQVKTASSSKRHPDLAKLGTMFKDLLDFALENGVDDDYVVSGLLTEGPTCTIFSLRKLIPKNDEVKETVDLLLEMATLLNTGLDRETLGLCVSLCERGVNPEALASVIKDLRQQELTATESNTH